MSTTGGATVFGLRIAELPRISTTTHQFGNLALAQFVDIDWLEIDLAMVAYSVEPSITPGESALFVASLEVTALLERVEVFTYLTFGDGDLFGNLVRALLLKAGRRLDAFTHPRGPRLENAAFPRERHPLASVRIRLLFFLRRDRWSGSRRPSARTPSRTATQLLKRLRSVDYAL